MEVKSASIFLLVIGILAVSQFAIAQNSVPFEKDGENLAGSSIDDATKEEVAIMNSNRGAEIRLLQLEKAIVKRILKGELVIEAFDEVGEDTTELVAILDSLKELKTKVSELDSASEDRVEQFVSLKAEAIELVKSFKDIAREMKSSLTEEKLEELRTAFKEINVDNRSELEKIRERVREQIRFHNADRVKEFLGDDAEDIVQKVRDGEITKAQIRERLRNSFAKLTDSQRKKIYERARQLNADRTATKELLTRVAVEKVDVTKLRSLRVRP